MDTTNKEPREDFLGEIFAVSTTFTEQAMAAAARKCKELGFDPDRGLIPLQETFINLSSARGIIEDAVEKNKLTQLPITVQRELLASLQAIAKSLQGFTDGSDEVVNLTNAVEGLNTSIWKYGLHNLSDQVLGYQRKLNQIKNIEVQLSKATEELETARKAADLANSAASDIDQKKMQVLSVFENLQNSATSAATLLDQIKDIGAKASVLGTAIEQQEKQGGEMTSNIKTASNELLSLDASIKKFYSEVDEYRKKINQTSEDAAVAIRTAESNAKKVVDDTTAAVNTATEALRETEATVTEQLTKEVGDRAAEAAETLSKSVEDMKASIKLLQTELESDQQSALHSLDAASTKLLEETTAKLNELQEKTKLRSTETLEVNNGKTKELIEELEKLKDQIREQIQQATGFRLFGAFQSRQNEIVGSKKIWAYPIAILVALSAGVTIWIAHEAQAYTVGSFAFWVKLSLTIPLAYAITFCTLQYSRERLLEEEYAFKSSISVSLNPYRDLIQSILQKDGVDQAKYAEFVIESVRNVFTSPTERVFAIGQKKNGLTEKALKQTAEIIGTGIKAAK